MPQRTIRYILTLVGLAIVSATIALAQSPTSPQAPATPTRNTWQVAQLVGSSKGKLFVVTLDQPHRRQTCRAAEDMPTSGIGGNGRVPFMRFHHMRGPPPSIIRLPHIGLARVLSRRSHLRRLP
jgi:hypothetical protein